MSHSKRVGKSCAVMFVDLDKFKPVNDNFGHRIGDDLLRMVAQRLAASVRKEDTVARAGGDEFIVVLSEIAKRDDAAIIGRKILEQLSQSFHINRYELNISCSIGISVYPDDGKDMETLKVNADIAMYQAKKEGRNNFQFFEPGMGVAAPQPAR